MITIDGEQVTEVFSIWSIRYTDADDKEQEIIYPDGEEAATEDLSYVGGSLWMRRAYSTATKPVAHVEEAEQVSHVRQLN